MGSSHWSAVWRDRVAAVRRMKATVPSRRLLLKPWPLNRTDAVRRQMPFARRNPGAGVRCRPELDRPVLVRDLTRAVQRTSSDLSLICGPLDSVNRLIWHTTTNRTNRRDLTGAMQRLRAQAERRLSKIAHFGWPQSAFPLLAPNGPFGSAITPAITYLPPQAMIART